MSLSKTKERSLGIFLQYTQMGLSIVIQLIYIPIMLRILGSNEYGIYSIASSIIAYLNLLSLGFGASYLRYYSQYKKEDDEDGIKRLNGLYLLVFSVIGVVSLIVGLFLTRNVYWFYNETYSSGDIQTAKILMFFLSINMAISFPASVFVSYITSQERFVFQKLVNMGKTVVSPAVNIIVLFLGYGSIGMVVSTTVISLIIDFLNIAFCMLRLKMRISFSKPNLFLLKEIFVFSIFIAINQLIDQINWQTDKVILGKMINGTAVAIYSVGASINTMFVSFSTTVSSVFAPKINMIVSKNEETVNLELTDLFIRVGRIQWFLVSLILSGFVFFGRFFIYKWAGEGYGNSFWVALLLISPMIIPSCQTLGIEIQRAKNKHKVRSLVYLAMALINVAISIWFASMWGEIGCALGTTISILIGPCIFMNFYYYLKLDIDVIRFWKSILRTTPAMIMPIILGVCLNRYYCFVSLKDFFAFVLLYVFVFGISVFFFGFNKTEKEYVKNLTKRLFKRCNS